MYTAFFGLREKPFSLSPDPRFLFLSGAHREALAHLLYGIEQGEGFIAVTGEVGTGKTTLCRTLLRRLPSDVDTAFLFNPKLGAHELLEALLQEFEIKCEATSPRALINALNEFLLEKRREGRRVLLILDEAQGLESATLEQIRLLSNLETESAKLLQILMLGQPELDEMLASPALRQLRQRIGVRWRLSCLTREEAADYIAHRLRIAAGGDRNLFTPGALRAIHRRSGGVPRRINLLCDRALLAAYGRGVPQVTRALAVAAARELDGNSIHRGWCRAAAIVAGAAVLAGGFVCSGGLEWSQTRIAQITEAGAETRAERAAVSTPPPAGLDALRRSALSFPTAESSTVLAAMAPSGVQDRIAASADTSAEALPDHFEAAILSDPSVETLRRGALEILGAWQLRPAPASLGFDLQSVLQRARELGLQVHSRVGMRFEELRDLGHPALLRLDSGHIVGLRAVRGDRGSLVALVGFSEKPLWVPATQLEEHWSGEAHVFWKDPEGLPAVMTPTQSGRGILWLQGVLIELGYLSGDPSGYFDPGTATALRAFQRDSALQSDGQVGPLTKMALYHSLSRYPVPRLRDAVSR